MTATFKGYAGQWYNLGDPNFCGFVGGPVNNTE
jgi:hypothetical protein